jgi:glycosyl transferase family 25
MELLKNTLFINLEHRKDRLEHVTKQFEKLGIKGERFNAIKTTSGAIGCTMSHIKCLELAIERNYDYVLICEDDITFLDINIFTDSITKLYNDKEINWDVLLISGNNAPPYEKTRDYCVRISNCRCGTGYIVKNHYLKKLVQNMREGLAHLIRDPTNKPKYALDMYWNSLQRADQWYLLTPLTVVQAPCYSDIELRNVNYKDLMLDLDKPWLFRGTVGSPGRPLPFLGNP